MMSRRFRVDISTKYLAGTQKAERKMEGDLAVEGGCLIARRVHLS